MNKRIRKRKCNHCKEFFIPDHRNVKRQKFCNKPQCRKESKKYSQHKWLNKEENKNYFKGKANVERVQRWRENYPKYWNRQNNSLNEKDLNKNKDNQCVNDLKTKTEVFQANLDKDAVKIDTLQDSFHENNLINQYDKLYLHFDTLQDSFKAQHLVLIGLIANLTDTTLQDDIVKTINSMRQIGLDIISYPNSTLKGEKYDFKTPNFASIDSPDSKTI